MINYIAVFIGGGLGCLLRFFANNLYVKWFENADKLYYATFILNFVGSIIIAILAVLFMIKQDFPDYIKFALTVGFCGGLTTFSTFSLEVFKMLENGQFLTALAYILTSVIVCVSGVFIGLNLGKMMV